MLTTLSALLATASAAVLLPPNPAQRWIEPFPYLSGGAFSGAQLPFCADPLGTYQWEPSVNASQLQVRVGKAVGSWRVPYAPCCSVGSRKEHVLRMLDGTPVVTVVVGLDWVGLGWRLRTRCTSLPLTP